LVLIEQPRDGRGKGAIDPALLGRLAVAAGIAPEWWDVRGSAPLSARTHSGPLLAAMRLPATTEGEARDILRCLSDDLDRRALPVTSLGTVGKPSICDLASTRPLSAGRCGDAGTGRWRDRTDQAGGGGRRPG